MKVFICLPFILLAAHPLFSQNGSTSIGMSKEFSQLAAGSNGKQMSTGAYQTYNSNQIDGNQFFLPDWEYGEVELNNKEKYSKGLVFVYDKVRQELFIRQKDSSVVLLGSKDDIKSFVLDDHGKRYSFINSSNFGNIKPEVFYQVLVDNPSNDTSKLTLLKFTTAKLVKANMADMSSQRQGVVNDAFVDSYTYYIIKGVGEIRPLQLKTKAVKKTFAEMNINPENYMKDHYGAMNEDYLVDMVTELNK